jgi:hypothetical protein
VSVLQACDQCREARLLLARVAGEWLCARCWRDEGCPSQPAQSASYEAEQHVRERMTARGGEASKT